MWLEVGDEMLPLGGHSLLQSHANVGGIPVLVNQQPEFFYEGCPAAVLAVKAEVLNLLQLDGGGLIVIASSGDFLFFSIHF